MMSKQVSINQGQTDPRMAKIQKSTVKGKKSDTKDDEAKTKTLDSPRKGMTSDERKTLLEDKVPVKDEKQTVVKEREKAVTAVDENVEKPKGEKSKEAKSPLKVDESSVSPEGKIENLTSKELNDKLGKDAGKVQESSKAQTTKIMMNITADKKGEKTERDLADMAATDVLKLTAESSTVHEYWALLKNQQVLAHSIATQTGTMISLPSNSWIPTSNRITKIQDRPPSLLKIRREANTNSRQFAQFVEEVYGKNYPDWINATREIFGPDTAEVRVVIDSENTLTKVSLDPRETITSTKPLFDLVTVQQLDSADNAYTGPQSLMNRLDAVFGCMLDVYKSCRVEIRKPRMQRLYRDEDNAALDGFLGGQVLPKDVGPHITIGALSSPVDWFENKVIEFVQEYRDDARLGERMSLKYGVGMRKEQVIIRYAIDQFACKLNWIHQERLQNKRQTIHTRMEILNALAAPGTNITLKYPRITDDYYMVEGIQKEDVDAFLFFYAMTPETKTTCFLILQQLLSSIGLVRSRMITDLTAQLSDKILVVAEAAYIKTIQANYTTMGGDQFIDLMVMNANATFIDIMITPRTSNQDTLDAVIDLVALLTWFIEFPAIASQNLHRLGYSICKILDHLENADWLNFVAAHGFAKDMAGIGLIKDDVYRFNGDIPYIFDKDKTTRGGNIKKKVGSDRRRINVIDSIRSLLEGIGTMVTVTTASRDEFPRFENVKKCYLPHSKIERHVGGYTTPWYIKMMTIIDIAEEVFNDYSDRMKSPKSTHFSGIKILLQLKEFFKEHGSFLHDEGNFLNLLMVRHWALVYSDYKSDADMTKPKPYRFAVATADAMDDNPWVPEYEIVQLPWQSALNAALSIVGVLRSVTDGETYTNPPINFPNPIFDFQTLKSAMFGAADTAEPFAVMVKVLDDDQGGLMSLIHTLLLKSSSRSSFIHMLTQCLDKGPAYPPSLLKYITRGIQRVNKIKMLMPKIVMVDRFNRPKQYANAPDICNRVLRLGDNFIQEELQVAQELLMGTNSFINRMGTGIYIQRSRVGVISVSNARPLWTHARREIAFERWPIFTTQYIDGDPYLAFYDTETDKHHVDPEDCEFPKILWQMKHPEQIKIRTIEEKEFLFKLIKRGTWAFYFADFMFHASVVNANAVAEALHVANIETIFATKRMQVPQIRFFDTSLAKTSLYDKGKLYDMFQYIFTGKEDKESGDIVPMNLENDVLIKDISGYTPSIKGWKPIDPRHWIADDNLHGYQDPKFPDGKSKVQSGIPNFNNAFVTVAQDSLLREEPEVEVTYPQYYYDAL